MTLRSLWLMLGWCWVSIVFYLSLTPHPPEPVSFDGADKFEHMLAYGMLMLWFCQLHIGRVGLAAGFVGMGVGLEFLQGMTGYRVFEYADMAANSVGVLAGWGLALTRMGNILETLEQHGRR